MSIGSSSTSNQKPLFKHSSVYKIFRFLWQLRRTQNHNTL